MTVGCRADPLPRVGGFTDETGFSISIGRQRARPRSAIEAEEQLNGGRRGRVTPSVLGATGLAVVVFFSWKDAVTPAQTQQLSPLLTLRDMFHLKGYSSQ